jgi:polyferredoxin
MISEEIKNIKESNKDLRKFGITVGAAFIIIAAFLFWKQSDIYFYFGIAGLFLFLAGLISPVILKPVNKAWMVLAILMGWLMTRVILTILFFVILTPISFLSKLFRKDFLNLKIDHNKESYWEKREEKKLSPADYEKQF